MRISRSGPMIRVDLRLELDQAMLLEGILDQEVLRTPTKELCKLRGMVKSVRSQLQQRHGISEPKPKGIEGFNRFINNGVLPPLEWKHDLKGGIDP